MRHYDHAQKIFQIGEDSSLGIAFWGLACLPNTSHRTMVARFADSLRGQPAPTVSEAAVRWANLFWGEYRTQLAPVCERAAELAAKTEPTDEERQELARLMRFTVGFCLGGCLPPSRDPAAFEIMVDPTLNAAPVPRELPSDAPTFWGQPSLINRLVYGIDPPLIRGHPNVGALARNDRTITRIGRTPRLGHTATPADPGSG